QVAVEQLFRGHPHPVNVAGTPTNVHAQVAAIGPAHLRESLREPGEVDLRLRIGFSERHQNTDPPYATGLLRRTAIGHAAALPSSVTTSRRPIIRSPRRRARAGLAECQCQAPLPS